MSGLSSVVSQKDLIAHNLEVTSHPPLRDLQESCDEQAHLALKRVEELREDQVMTLRRLARLVAADAEPNRNRKADAARKAEAAFRREVRKGTKLEDAFIEAINYASRRR